MIAVLSLVQGPTWIDVGNVTAVYWSGDAQAAVALAELASDAGPWPGIGTLSDYRIRLIVVSDGHRFDSLLAGRIPEWGVGAAIPSRNMIVLRLVGDVRRTLRHELAHLALHAKVPHVPRWFDEGYAVRAAGEWDRLDALRVNWALVRGKVPTLRELNTYLRDQTASRAETAYALAATAVLSLERFGGERGLEPFIETLATELDFDRALRTTHQMTFGQFEERWRRELRERYGWLFMITTFSAFWAVAGVMLVALWIWRKHRDKERRAALDEGWVIPDSSWDGPA